MLFNRKVQTLQNMFSTGKSENIGFSENFGGGDLKVGRCRQKMYSLHSQSNFKQYKHQSTKLCFLQQAHKNLYSCTYAITEQQPINEFLLIFRCHVIV